jgi:secreted PhoX family phosphatase
MPAIRAGRVTTFTKSQHGITNQLILPAPLRARLITGEARDGVRCDFCRRAITKGHIVKPIDYEGDKNRILSTKGTGETMAEIIARRYSRRSVVATGAAASAMVLMGARGVAGQDADATPVGATPAATAVTDAPSLTFEAIRFDAGDEMVVADGYEAIPFLRWGDPLFPDAPEFDPENQTAASQAMQVGYNCDFIDFMPLPMGSDTSDHGLLVVNHEYTNPEIMFPGYLSPNPDFVENDEESAEFLSNTTQEIVDTELEAHGLSIVEIQRTAEGQWEVVLDSEYNRRITATTPTEMTGPAAGADALQTSADPTGIEVIGTLNNCAGGHTPWGTIISGEENFQQYFANMDAIDDEALRANYERFGVNGGASDRLWEQFHDRFDLAKEPNEANRFGWGLEFDPYDANSTPKKRSALGRNKHEGHTSAISTSGQVAIYSGDDEVFEYAYKFVSAGAYDPENREANLDLLDEGTLYVARYNEDGTGDWLPLVHGENGLDESNGFASQADVLINPRAASDVLGATKMDRPEDFETNPVNGRVYLVLTSNLDRGEEGYADTDEANPRGPNYTGHIIEMTEEGGDHAATTFVWDIFILCGDPAADDTYFGGYPKDQVSPISAPDNITFDSTGNLWISTDGCQYSFEANDGLFAVPVDGPERGYLRQFFSAVPGSEVSGPIFNPDNTALWASVQHPGEGSTYEEPSSRWPDGEGPPRPTVVLIHRSDNGPIGQ